MEWAPVESVVYVGAWVKSMVLNAPTENKEQRQTQGREHKAQMSQISPTPTPPTRQAEHTPVPEFVLQ